MEKQELQVIVGKRIKDLRESKGFSLQDFADKCGFDKSNYHRLEAGKTNPSVFTLYTVAQVLELPVKELIEF